MVSQKRIIIFLVLTVIVLSSATLCIYSLEQSRQKLVIYHAGSLIVPFSRLKSTFEEKYPNVDVILQTFGSVDAARQITDLHKKGDLLAVADYNVIEKYLFPENWSNWYIVFARNELVIAYTNHSRYADEINSQNWFKILMKPDVKFGHSAPDRDPAGYRTILMWKLAERYYNNDIIYDRLINSSNRVTRFKSVDLIALLEFGEIDFAFEYKSVALQHNLNYVELPSEINFGDINKRDWYSSVNITLSDGTIIFGDVILYGVTIPRVAENYDLAVKFLKLLLSDEGTQVLLNSYQIPLTPALAYNSQYLPPELQGYVQEFNH
ncbi:MAG: tungstate ABC transporter substrate-binding protein WtpA [Candidatus Asgardarchaeia archaeon]